MRKLTVALAVGVAAAFGFFGPASSAGAATTEPVAWHHGHHDASYALKALCRPDPRHVRLAVYNNTEQDAEFKIERLYPGGQPYWIAVEAGKVGYVTVPYHDEDEVWALYVKRYEDPSGAEPGPEDGVSPEYAEESNRTGGEPDAMSTYGATGWGGSWHGGESPWQKVDKVKVECPRWCPKPKPTHKPTAAPETTAPAQEPLPVTGTSMVSLMGVGAGLFGAGAALLLLGRRRRGVRRSSLS